jgi:type I restriction enzyme, S subunit
MDVKPGYSHTEAGLIPEDWGVFTLGDTCIFENGDRGHNYPSKAAFVASGVPFINAGHVEDGRILRGSLDYIRREHFDLLGGGKTEPGDILFCLRGSLGKFGVVAADIPEGAIASSLIIIRPRKSKLSLGFLICYLKSNLCVQMIELWAGGAAQPNLGGRDLARFAIPLPPTKAEQEAIADALSDADALIESLEQLITKKRQIKQGTMQELLTGKKRLPGFSGEWELKQLGELAAFYKGKGLPKSSLDPYGTVACIHYGELFTSYPETIRGIISRTNNSEDSFLSKTNDVLMPTSDVTPNGLAKASCIGVSGVILGGDILVIRSEEERVNGSFLSYVIRHQEAQVLQLVTGTTVFHLYASDMRKFHLPLPTVAEQEAIVTFLSDMDAEIAALEAKLAKARQIKLGMMRELLTGRIRLI